MPHGNPQFFHNCGFVSRHAHTHPMQKEYAHNFRNVPKNARTGPHLSFGMFHAASASASACCTAAKARDLGSNSFPSTQRLTRREKPVTARCSSSSALVRSSGLVGKGGGNHRGRTRTINAIYKDNTQQSPGYNRFSALRGYFASAITWCVR